MNAPKELAGQTLPISAPLNKIFPSLTNPRKRFPADKHAEMVASVKQHGVLQPILLRPFPKDRSIPSGASIADTLDAHELVSGERRYRAAKDARLVEVLGVVRELTDSQVLEIQIVENLQREDVHPIEEAEGFQFLMDKHGFDADQIAEKIGKSRAYVYARLKLTALCEESREAFYNGKLDASTALLIARIPGNVLQKKATKEITEGYGGEPISYRSAKDHIQRNFMLSLEHAKWDRSDAKLCAAAGSCNDCKKRTGNDPELFSDVKGADVCIDPKCYEDKHTAHYLQLRARAEKRGLKVLEGDEAQKVMPHGVWSLKETEFINLDDECKEDEDGRTYREILGDKAPVAALIETGNTNIRNATFIEVAEPTALAKALEKAGIKRAEPLSEQKTERDSSEKPEWKIKREAQEAKAEKETAFRGRVFQQVREKAGEKFAAGHAITQQDLASLVIGLWNHFTENASGEAMEALRATWGNPDIDNEQGNSLEDFDQRIASLEIPALYLLMIDLLVIEQTQVGWYEIDGEEQPGLLLTLANRFEINAESLREIAPTPSPAAQAQEDAAPEKSTEEAAPTVEEAKPKAAPKKPRAKANPASAKPTNEPAAPVKPSAPTKPKAAKKVAIPAQATPAEESKTESTATKPRLDPVAAWPFPSGNYSPK